VSVIRPSGEVAGPLGRPGVLAQARMSLLHRRASTLRRLLALGDGIAIAASLGVAVALLGPSRGAWGQLAIGLLLLPLWIVLFKIYGLYDRDAKRVSHSTVDDMPWLFHGLVIGSLGLYALTKPLPVPPLSLRQTSLFFLVSFVAVLVARVSVRQLARAALPPERLLFVGDGPMVDLLVEKIRRSPQYGLEPVGYLGAEHRADSELPYLGGLGLLEKACGDVDVDHVVFVAPTLEDETLEDLVRRTTHLNVRIGILPHVVDALGPSVEIDHIQGVTVLGISPPTLPLSSRLLKRTMDLLVASAAIILAAPVMVLIGILVKVTSPGPILFSQERVGRGDRRFRIHKFRTMVEDAEEREQELQALSKDPGWLLLDDDPRITRLGRFLRHTSLDELPELWNVLVGDMSLVGPRPMTPAIDERISGWQRRRIDLTPGITGLWQVLGRTSIPFEEMLKLDYVYVTNWSLWQDVRLLLQTLPAVLRRRGVN
jgi:exopolysaccharide biosynthesis polyprenyl glycosylphosphotransferase